jgi:hypothetical protein
MSFWGHEQFDGEGELSHNRVPSKWQKQLAKVVTTFNCGGCYYELIWLLMVNADDSYNRMVGIRSPNPIFSYLIFWLDMNCRQGSRGFCQKQELAKV